MAQTCQTKSTLSFLDRTSPCGSSSRWASALPPGPCFSPESKVNLPGEPTPLMVGFTLPHQSSGCGSSKGKPPIFGMSRE